MLWKWKTQKKETGKVEGFGNWKEQTLKGKSQKDLK